MATKVEERKALKEIKDIIAALGEDSYIGTALDGALDLADQNIEYDAAFSVQYYIDRCHSAEEEITGHQNEVVTLQNMIDDLRAKLEKEQEWKPYESNNNVSQADYERLAGFSNGTRHMTDEEAKDWICDEFGFDRSKVVILHEIDEEEINRHRQCRKTGKKIDRHPVYCATDYYYIRFNVSNWFYEAWNGQLRPFYC